MRIISYLGQKRYESIVKTGMDAGQTVKERLLRRFYSLAEQYGRKETDSTVIDLRITQQELADMIGSSRVMVVKALKELQAANIIDREKRYYRLKGDPCISIHMFE